MTDEKLIKILKASPGLKRLTITNCHKLNLNQETVKTLLAHKQLELIIDLKPKPEKINTLVLFFIFRAQREFYYKKYNRALFYYEEACKLGKSLYLVNKVVWLRKNADLADETLGLPDDLDFSNFSKLPIWDRWLAFDILLKNLDKYPGPLGKILTDIQDIPFISLDLSRFADVLDDALFSIALKNSHEYLLDLDLQGCEKITDKSLNILNDCKQLERLNLARNNIKIVRNTLFQNLNELTISDCSLTGLTLNAPNLKKLSITNCKNLTNLTIGTLQLQKLTLINCGKLSEKQFTTLTDRMKNVADLTIQDCDALKYSKFRESFPWLIRFSFNNFTFRHIESLTNLLNDIFKEPSHFLHSKALTQKTFSVVFEDIYMTCSQSFETIVSSYHSLNNSGNNHLANLFKASILKNIGSFGLISEAIINILTEALNDKKELFLAAMEGVCALFENNNVSELNQNLQEKFAILKTKLKTFYENSTDSEIMNAILPALQDDITPSALVKLLLISNEKQRESTLKILRQPKLTTRFEDVVEILIKNLSLSDNNSLTHEPALDILLVLAENSSRALIFLSENYTQITDLYWQKKFVKMLGKNFSLERRAIIIICLNNILSQKIDSLEIRIIAAAESLKLTLMLNSVALKNSVTDILSELINKPELPIDLQIMFILALASYKSANIAERMLIIAELNKILANATQEILKITTIKIIVLLNDFYLKKYANEILQFALSKELAVQQVSLEILGDGKLIVGRPMAARKLAIGISKWVSSQATSSHLPAINALEKIGHYIFKLEQVFEMLVEIFVYNFNKEIRNTLLTSLHAISLRVSPSNLMYLAQLLLSVLYDKSLKLDETQRSTIYQILIELNFLLPEIIQKLINTVKDSATLPVYGFDPQLVWNPAIVSLQKISSPSIFGNFIKTILSKQDFSLQLEQGPAEELKQIRRHSYAVLPSKKVPTIPRKSNPPPLSSSELPAWQTIADTSTELNKIFERLKIEIGHGEFKTAKKIYQGLNKASKYVLLKKTDKSGNSLLHEACKGPYAHPALSHDYYALSLQDIAAVEKPYLLTLDWLLSLGANTTATNFKKELPLHVAIQERSLAIIKKLLEATPFEYLTAVNAEGANIIHLAVSRQKHALPIFELIINEVNKRTNSIILLNNLLISEDFSGNFPIHYICAKINFTDPAAILIKYLDTLMSASSSNMTIINDALETPLHLAIKQLNLDVLKRLLPEFGKIINARDIHGNTALHLFIKYLIAKKSAPEVDVKTESDNSFWILDALLNYGANSYELNGQAQTVIEMTATANLPNIADMLKNTKKRLAKDNLITRPLETEIKGLVQAEQPFVDYYKIGMVQVTYKNFIDDQDKKEDSLVFLRYQPVLTLILESNDSSFNLPHEDIVLNDIKHAKIQIKNSEKKIYEVDDLEAVMYSDRIAFYNEVIRRAQMIFQIPYYRNLYQSCYQNNQELKELFLALSKNLNRHNFFFKSSQIGPPSLVLGSHRSNNSPEVSDNNAQEIPEGKQEITNENKFTS